MSLRNPVESESGGFDPACFAELVELEESNFWFVNRNRLILWFLRRYTPEFRSYLEIGCGTGYVLADIAKHFPESELCATELFAEGLSHARRRVPAAEFIEIAAENIDFYNKFDLAGAFDVLEHIGPDALALERLYHALKPGGHLLLTVPQHEWLWSGADSFARHERRYSRKTLVNKLEGAGFEIVRITSFVSLLLPLLLLSRKLRKNKKFNVLDEMRISPWLNSMLLVILTVERLFIQCGFNFPAGGSLLVLARKKL